MHSDAGSRMDPSYQRPPRAAQRSHAGVQEVAISPIDTMSTNGILAVLL